MSISILSSHRSRLPSSKPQPAEKTFFNFSPRSIDISPHLNQSLHYYDQDVVRELSIPPESSSSLASLPTRRYQPPVNGPPYSYYPTAETSRFPTFQQHVYSIASQSSSLRTPPVNLLSQHGLPSSLPPPPRTTFVAESAPPVQNNINHNNNTDSSDLVKILDSLLSGSYINMLANKTDTSITDASSASAVENTAGDFSFDDLLRQDMFEDYDYLTSPQLDQQQQSPDETPFIDTPLDGTFNTPILFDPEYDSFHGYDLPGGSDGGMPPPFGSEFPQFKESVAPDVESSSFQFSPYFTSPSLNTATSLPATVGTDTDASKLEPITPALPPLDQAPYTIHDTPSMSPSLLFTPATPPVSLPTQTITSSSTQSQPSSSRPTKPLPTGIRRGITPSSLVPLDAPTQPRQYATPSATSRKVIPAAFLSKGKKRDRSESVLEDTTPDPNSNPDDLVDENMKDAIEAKRRQNTLAARRSRQRKLEYTRELEERLEDVCRERDMWRGRASEAERKLMEAGLL